MTSRDLKGNGGSTVGYPSDSLASCFGCCGDGDGSFDVHARHACPVVSEVIIGRILHGIGAHITALGR